MVPSEFVTFGVEHGVSAALVLGSAVGLAVAVRRSGSERLDRAVRWTLAVACVAHVAGYVGWRAQSGNWPLVEVLPLHLCDLSILLAPVVLLTGRRYAFELLYFWGISGALQSIATPTVLDGFPSAFCLVFFLGHALIIASALYAVVVMRMRPVPRSLVRVWLVTIAYAATILPVNLALGTNFLFIARKPITWSLLDWLGPWPWYLLSVQPAVVVVMLLCYAPFWVSDRREGGGARARDGEDPAARKRAGLDP